MLAAVLASWWLVATVTPLLAPAAPALLPLDAPQPQAAAGNVAQQAWFGSRQQATAQAAPPLQVVGVLGGGHGSQQDFAIVIENGQTRPLRVGEQSPGGWWLRKVDGAGVLIQQQGGAAVRVGLSPAAGRSSPVAATTAGMPPTLSPQMLAAGNGMASATQPAASPAEGGNTPAAREVPVSKD